MTDINLPVKTAWYNTLNWQAAGGVVANTNTCCDNWYFTKCINLCCEKQFWNEFKLYSPRIVIDNTHPWSISLIDKYEFPKVFLKYSVEEVIQSILENGYYLYFSGLDDYYIENKQGFNRRHNSHDGMIVGVNNTEKVFSIFAYDSNNKLRSFNASKIAFEKAYNSYPNEGVFLALKNNNSKFDYNFNAFVKNLESYYLSKQTDKYKNPNDFVFGMEAVNHVAKYVKSFYEHNIPFNLFDLRTFSSLWENKRCIYNSLLKAQREGFVSQKICEEYNNVFIKSEIIKMISVRFELSGDIKTLKDLYNTILDLLDLEQTVLSLILNG